MGARYDNIAGVQHKVSKRYDNVNGVWRPVSKRYNNIGGAWRQSYSKADCKVHVDASTSTALSQTQLHEDGSGYCIVGGIIGANQTTLTFYFDEPYYSNYQRMVYIPLVGWGRDYCRGFAVKCIINDSAQDTYDLSDTSAYINLPTCYTGNVNKVQVIISCYNSTASQWWNFNWNAGSLTLCGKTINSLEVI